MHASRVLKRHQTRNDRINAININILAAQGMQQCADPSFASCSAKKAPFTATTKSHTHAKPRPALSAEPSTMQPCFARNDKCPSPKR
eukprot:2406256-Amphidinium_carterae.1